MHLNSDQAKIAIALVAPWHCPHSCHVGADGVKEEPTTMCESNKTPIMLNKTPIMLKDANQNCISAISEHVMMSTRSLHVISTTMVDSSCVVRLLLKRLYLEVFTVIVNTSFLPSHY